MQAQAIEQGKDDQTLAQKNFSAIKGRFGPVEDALNALRLGDRKLVEDKFKDLRPPPVQRKKTKGAAKSNAPENSKESQTNPSSSTSMNEGRSEHVSESTPSTANPLKARTKRAKQRVEKALSQSVQPEAIDKNKQANETYTDLQNQGLIGFAPQSD